MGWIMPAIQAVGAISSIHQGKKDAKAGGQINSTLGAGASGIIENFMSSGAPALKNFINNPLQTMGPEIQAVTNSYDSANRSFINTEKEQLGGIANPNLFFRDAFTNEAQNRMQTSQKLGSDLVGQWLQAIGMQEAPLGASFNTLGNLGQEYNQAAGSSFHNALGDIAGVAGAFQPGGGLSGLFGGGGGGAGSYRSIYGGGPASWAPGNPVPTTSMPSLNWNPGSGVGGLSGGSWTQ